MRLLILGGTAWLGRQLVLEALEAGHTVTCLARASSGPVPAGALWVPADREGERALDPVCQHDWDAVIDLARQPGQVRMAAQALAGRCGTYVFISSTSVYADTHLPDQDEQAAVVPPLEADSFQTPGDYGAAKVACENHVRRALGARALMVRPGLIGGPGDPTGRSGYWPRRFWQATSQVCPVLVPNVDSLLTQVIDVRDLARWVVTAASRHLAGTFNATGRAVPLADHLRVAQQVAGFTGPLRKVPPAWLQAQGVAPWAGARSLPLWVPVPSHAGFCARSVQAALDQGLALRPLADTLRDTLAWELQDAHPWPRQAGLSDADEHELLERSQLLSD